MVVSEEMTMKATRRFWRAAVMVALILTLLSMSRWRPSLMTVMSEMGLVTEKQKMSVDAETVLKESAPLQRSAFGLLQGRKVKKLSTPSLVSPG